MPSVGEFDTHSCTHTTTHTYRRTLPDAILKKYVSYTMRHTLEGNVNRMPDCLNTQTEQTADDRLHFYLPLRLVYQWLELFCFFNYVNTTNKT